MPRWLMRHTDMRIFGTDSSQIGGFSPDMQPTPKPAMSDLKEFAKFLRIEYFTGPDQLTGGFSPDTGP